jgi:mono/diheme cytochrome c family protein
MPMTKNSVTLLGAAVLCAACETQVPATPPQALPDAESTGAQLLMDRCGQCHGVPAPTTHTAQTWSGVVHRMQNRMAQKGKKPLTPDEINTLVAYLNTHARVTP